jgi:hypothetical protein
MVSLLSLRLLAAAAAAIGVLAAYSPNLAKEAAFLSSIAYCPGGRIASWSCGTACDQHPLMNSTTIVQYNKDRDVLSYVGHLPNGSTFQPACNQCCRD